MPQMSFLKIIKPYFCLIVIGLSLSAHAFETSYLNTDSSNWDCQFSAPNWVCTHNNEPQKTILVVNSQVVSESKNINTLSQFLQKPRARKNNKGITELSKVISFNNTEVSGYKAIESVHYQGELSNYYSHYIIAFFDDLIVNFSFHGHKDVYSQYKTAFLNLVSSSEFVHLRKEALTESVEPISQVAAAAYSENISFQQRLVSKVNDQPLLILIFLLVLVIIGLIIYFIKTARE